jgi:hypothetical protein
LLTAIAEQQLKQLARTAPPRALEALQLARRLRKNPTLGEELHSRDGVAARLGARRIPFDIDDHTGRPGYWLAYRVNDNSESSEPTMGAITVLAIVKCAPPPRATGSGGSRGERLRQLREALGIEL